MFVGISLGIILPRFRRRCDLDFAAIRSRFLNGAANWVSQPSRVFPSTVLFWPPWITMTSGVGGTRRNLCWLASLTSCVAQTGNQTAYSPLLGCEIRSPAKSLPLSGLIRKTHQLAKSDSVLTSLGKMRQRLKRSVHPKRFKSGSSGKCWFETKTGVPFGRWPVEKSRCAGQRAALAP